MANAEAEPKPPTAADQLDALFSPWNVTDAPGLVVGVAHHTAVIYRRGFGMASLESAVANTPKTRMRIGSTTKHFTCLLALLLAEDGKLDLDAPIRAYVPELTGPGGDPSLRLLLQHRGGSRCSLDLGFLGHGMNVPPKGAALAAQVRQQGRNFAPGEAMLYNNGGYHLVSIAIERVGGAPFEAQLKARLFDPVGMNDTASIPSDHDITPGIATMHVPARDGRWRRGLFPSDEVRGEGAMVSTVDDMLRWMAHLRTRDRFGSANSWGQLTATPTFPNGAQGVYALGLMVSSYRGLRTIHHAGGVMGGTAQMLTLPNEGLDVIILANGARDANVVRLAEQVVDIVLADQVGAETPEVTAEDYKPWLGDWWSPETGMVYGLMEEKGALKLQVAKAPLGMPLQRSADGRLVLPGSSIGEIVIDTSDAGESLAVGFGGQTHRFRRLTGDGADAFAELASGRYVSDDAASVADIEQKDDKLTIRFSDGQGELAARLTALGPTVAVANPRGAMAAFASVLTLSVDGGRASGFVLNTTRTRHLQFRRA
jgi:CubicO group peptidase (beta-lactamase class C family)